MFSLHIDTARSWRGGQSQVMYTVLGLRSLGHRAVLVAHPEGELRPALEKQIRDHHLERHVFLAGFRADALAMTKGFDVFAMSSVSEGMCTALVDAMAASKAAVATTAGGIPEVMVDGSTGFLVRPRDHQAMADKLVTLLRDPGLRTRMGEAALARARERFTMERMVEGTAAVYARLLGLHTHQH